MIARSARPQVKKCHGAKTDHGRQRRETAEKPQVSEDRYVRRSEILNFCRLRVSVSYSETRWRAAGTQCQRRRLPALATDALKVQLVLAPVPVVAALIPSQPAAPTVSVTASMAGA